MSRAETNKKISEALMNNKNAEVWSFKEAEKFLNKALQLSKNIKYDFIGEIARDMDSYIDVFDYLIDKYPNLKSIKQNIKRNCEANCFSNSKKGDIREASAIMNLKSNHGWKDRSEVEVNGTVNVNPKEWV